MLRERLFASTGSEGSRESSATTPTMTAHANRRCVRGKGAATALFRAPGCVSLGGVDMDACRYL